MEKLYAKALTQLAHSEGADTKKLVEQLVKELTASGRTKLLPEILRELRVLEAKEAKRAPSVEVAHEKESTEALAEAKKLGIEVSKAHVNHALISGWRARSGGTLIDRSAKRGLIDLYRKVTN
ncbi:MAG: F0F1 ATP synthase subunit delta [Patescibacteria group bacterium]